MATTATYISGVNAVETLATNVPAVASSNNSLQHTGYSTSKALTGTGSSGLPAVTKLAYFSKALSTGTGTIDLTSLTGTNGATVDLTGLKVCLMKFRNPSTNANTITVAKGASNGFGLTTSGTTFSIPIPPGGEVTIFCDEGTPDVGGGAKTLDLTGTGSQTLECAIWGG